MIRIAGLVVLYNPQNDVWGNINSYLSDIEVLFVVDNSENYNLPLIENLKRNDKIIYTNNFGNKGIAKALNIGAKQAIEAGFDWLLTMDQDSSATNGMVDKMREFLEIYVDSRFLAILSPNHYLQNGNPIKKTEFHIYKNYKIRYELMVMTSGNLLHLSLYKNIGLFEEKLFIDYVDHEYGLRLNKLGYKIITLLDANLNHKLGVLKRVNLFFLKFHCTNHNYIRRYYITRNQLYVYNKYKSHFPEFCREDLRHNFKEWIRIILGEQDKLRKICSIIKGIRDYRRGKYGSYNR